MPQNRSRLTMLAGWLFADLFLLLLVAGLAALPAKTSVKPVKPNNSPTSTPTPTPTPTHHQGLDPNYQTFDISLSPDAYRAGSHSQLVSEVNAQLNRLGLTHSKIGFVLVFATDNDPNQAERAIITATDAYNQLHRQSPEFADAAGLGYWGGAGSDFQFKIFLLN